MEKPAESEIGRLIRKIHAVAKSRLRMSEEEYRETLRKLTGKTSCKELELPELRLVDAFLRGLLKKPGKFSSGRPHNFYEPSRHPLYTKIEALLAEAKRPWSYADTVARRRCKVDSLAFCKPHMLQQVVASLMYDKLRREKRRQS